MKVHAYSHTIQGIPFWITRPKVATKKAILLFPEAFNLTGHMVDVATRFARLGFNVYVPSLYFHQGYGIKYLIHPKDKDEREQRLQGLELSQFETSLVHYKNILLLSMIFWLWVVFRLVGTLL